MLKLAIAAGITLSAILCGMMTLGSNGLFQNSNKNLGILTDIKEIFGLYPIRTSNAQTSFKSGGDSSSFSLSGTGGYLPPKSVSEDENSTADMTTPLFRIFILSTSTTTNDPKSTSPPTTNDPMSTSSSTTNDPKSTSSPTTIASTVATQSSTTPLTISSPASPKTTPTSEETLTESTSAASSAQPPITPYAFQGNPMPGFKIDLIWSTLVPPSLSNSENEVAMNQNPVKSANNLASPLPRPNNGLYLPPNKEYLPPPKQ